MFLCPNPVSPHHQVHNFMLGLNLNTCGPFSPVSEVTCHAPTPEEEVDAVTGTSERNDSLFNTFKWNLTTVKVVETGQGMICFYSC